MDRVERLPEETEFKDSLTDLPFSVQQEILNREDALTYQYIFLCEEGPESRKDQGRETDRESASVIDLRRLHLQGLNDRIDELTEAFSDAQDLAMERLTALTKYEEELPKAQKIAFERLDEIRQLADGINQLTDGIKKMAEQKRKVDDQIRQIADQNRQMADQNRQMAYHIEQLREEIVTLKNHPGYRAYEKVKRILMKMKILRVDT